jgi:hypothetical protein
MLKVDILIQDYSALANSGRHFSPDWNLIRVKKIEYCVDDGHITENIADEAFHFTNRPDRENNEMGEFRDYQGPSLSVGDVVRVWKDENHWTDFLCVSRGWERKDCTDDFYDRLKAKAAYVTHGKMN